MSLALLCGTLDDHVLLYCNSPPSFHAFSDVDWAGNKDDCTSTSAYMNYLGCNLISRSSKKQHIFVRSATKAEYISIAATTAELTQVCYFLIDLGVFCFMPVIYWDNVGPTQLCSTPIFHSRMKHASIDFHFIQD